MGEWYIIEPSATENELADPAFELGLTKWTTAGDGTPGSTYEDDQIMFGTYAAVLDEGTGSYAYIYQTIGVTAVYYSLSAFVREENGLEITDALCKAWFNNASVNWATITSIGGGWYRVTYANIPASGSRQFGVWVSDKISIDGVQLELGIYSTTFCSGEEKGCYWTGRQFHSTSKRSALARNGGIISDLKFNYNFAISSVQGLGGATRSITIHEYNTLPGGTVDGIRRESREFTFIGNMLARDESPHALQNQLLQILSHDTYPETAEGPQPVQFLYTGGDVWSWFTGHYYSGLEGNWDTVALNQKAYLPLRATFQANDPLPKRTGNRSHEMTLYDSETINLIALRQMDGNGWSGLGQSDTTTEVSAILVSKTREYSNYVYLGGSFTTLDGVTGADNFCRYNPEEEIFEACHASGVNGPVEAILEGADGTIYIVGSFTTAGGVSCNRIAAYDPSAGTFSALGTGLSGAGYALAIDPSTGDLYAGGSFATAGGVTVNNIAYWDGAAWNALGTSYIGVTGTVYALAFDADNVLYVGGNLTAAGGLSSHTLTGCCYWVADDGDFYVMGPSLANTVFSIAIGPENIVYLGGSFAATGDSSMKAYGVAAWNGYAFYQLAGGVIGTVEAMSWAPDGTLWVVGEMTGYYKDSTDYTAVTTQVDRVLRWTGTNWIFPDLNLPGTNPVINNALSIAIGRIDPVVAGVYELWVGGTFAGTAYIGAPDSIAYNGTVPSHPKIVWHNLTTGSGIAYPVAIRNETTGQEILFDYALQEGELLTIDCHPLRQSIVSSHYGSVPWAVAASSDITGFKLVPGENLLTTFAVLPNATTDCFVYWEELMDGV